MVFWTVIALVMLIRWAIEMINGLYLVIVSIFVQKFGIWCSKKQAIVLRSSTESEYRALAIAAYELDSFLWIRSSLTELGVTLTSTPILWCDNQSATALASNPKFHSRTKHIELDVHFLQEKVATQSFQVRYVPSSDNVTDIMTKALSYHLFRSLCTKHNLITLGWAWGGMLDDKLIWCSVCADECWWIGACWWTHELACCMWASINWVE